LALGTCPIVQYNIRNSHMAQLCMVVLDGLKFSLTFLVGKELE
jgi:hypothetical protein